MQQIRTSITLFLFLFIANYSTVFAQEASTVGKLSGRVVNGAGDPVSYITVTLLKGESEVVNGALTDDNGKFTIENTGSGTFSLRVSGIGLTTKTIPGINILPGEKNKNIGEVKVETTTQQLDAVKITGEKPLMEMGIDKKVFNVEKNITAAGGSASDVLQNIPSVSVDIDGDVSLRGKGNVTILIDGKPATLLGSDAASALQSLPASSIENIEVITNPSAKYDAQGMTGIINIVTKKEKRFGVNGNVRLGASTRDKYNAGLSVNLKNDKWNIFFNTNWRQYRGYRRSSVESRTNSGRLLSKSYEDNLRMFDGWFNSLGAEYTFDKKNSMTLTQNVNKMRWGGKATSNFWVYDSTNTLVSRRERNSDYGGGPLSFSTTLDYKHKFGAKEHEWATSVTYANSAMNRDQEYITSFYNDNDELTQPIEVRKAPGTGENSSINAQTDYVQPILKEKGKLEAGLKTQLYWNSIVNDPVVDTGDGYKLDPVLKNDFEYTQQIYAAYTSFSHELGKFRYQAGLRAEYAYYEGTAYNLGNKRYSNEFLNLFPSVFASYELPQQQSVYVSYTRRIDRPRFWHLLPIVDLSNPQDTSIGNPDLIPEFIHSFELNYNKLSDKGHNFIASVYYQYTQNLIERYRISYEDGTFLSQRRNLNSGITYGLELIGKVQATKWWDATLSANFFQNEIQGANIDPAIDNSGFSWFAKLNTNFKLPKDFSIQVNGNYDAPKVIAQGTRQEVYWLDVALRKNFLNNKASLVLNVSDIFNTRKYTNNYDFGRNIQTNYYDRETRVGNITFTYNFGGVDSKMSKWGRRKGPSKKEIAPADANKERDNVKEDSDNDQNSGGF